MLLLSCLTGLLLVVLPTLAAWDALNQQFTPCYDATSGYSYCINLPLSYSQTSSTKWPLLVFLTGSGARGSLEQAPYLTTYSGVGYVLAQTLSNEHRTNAGKKIRGQFVTLMLVAPNTTSTHVINPDIVASVTQQALSSYNVAADQIYLLGYSMGCRGTLRTLVYHPSLWAAAICSAGYAERKGDPNLKPDHAAPTYGLLANAKDIPISFGYGTSDTTNLPKSTMDTRNQLVKAGNQHTQIQSFQSYTHFNMSTAQYSQAAIYDWLLGFRKPATQHQQGVVNDLLMRRFYPHLDDVL